MKLEKLPLKDTGSFSSMFLTYLEENKKLSGFYSHFPALKNFKDQISNKKFPKGHRSVLHAVIKDQYNGLEVTSLVDSNIDQLSDPKTFTVTTGHQLTLFTGPLYFVYKIITTINLAEALKKEYPSYNFVPVYWMASEDHDFEEIKSLNLKGEKYSWETPQKGPVGRFEVSGANELIGQIPGCKQVFGEAFEASATLAEAVRKYVNSMFGGKGIVVLDADDARLKRIFAPVVKEELFNNTSFEKVTAASASLESAGFQAQVTPREINLFYMKDGLRERIVEKSGKFTVLNSDKAFSKEEISEALESSPEVFSPNVILRPLYQEMILPNLAYVGGPSEVIYWLQLKDTFDYFKIPFPILLPRNFGMIISRNTLRKIRSSELTWNEVFRDAGEIKKLVTKRLSKNTLELEKERKEITKNFEIVRGYAQKVDSTLEPMTAAEEKRMMNSLDKIEKKLVRAEKRKFDDRMRQIDSIKEDLFPSGSLQERHENLLSFYPDDPHFFESLYNAFDPFDYSFCILYDDE